MTLHHDKLNAPGLALALVCGFPLHAAAADTAADAKAREWRASLVGGAMRQFDTSIDRGGEFEVDGLFFEGRASRQFGQAWNAGITLEYSEDRYGFSADGPGFGALDPWERIRNAGVGVPLRYRAGDQWTLIGIPSLRWSAESGASLSDGRTWGLLAGAAYRVNPRLTLGPGFGLFSDIEDDNSLFPILLVDWEISDTLSLQTGSGLEASRGPGVSLVWNPEAAWRWALSTRYEKRRFRLDDSAAAPGGVGEDSSVPVALSGRYTPHPDVELTLFGGVKFAGELRLEDKDGNRLSRSDYDTAPFAGAFARIRF